MPGLDVAWARVREIRSAATTGRRETAGTQWRMRMKRSKRLRGIKRRPDGKWTLRARVTDPRTGKRKEATRTLGPDASEEEAMAEFYRMKAELLKGKAAVAAETGKRLTVTDYAEQWLEAKAARVRPSVILNYESALSRFILPHLGDLYVDTLTRADVERWVAWAERAAKPSGEPYAADTVGGWWRVLCQFLRDAAAELRLPVEPTYRVRPPRPRKAPKRERRTLSAEDLGSLLRSVAQFTPDRYAEVYVLAYTGIRAGELFALKWEDVDEAAGCIHVRRSVWRDHVDATKTSDPRDVALLPAMAEVLRAHRRRMMAEQRPGLDKGWVFPSNRGTLRTPASLHKPLALAAEAARVGIKVTPQVLRRTFNTLMVRAGVDRIVLRSQMGHCSEEMTRRYAGIPVEDKQAAVRRLMESTEEKAE